MGDHGQCVQMADAAFFAFFCTAHCLLFRHLDAETRQ
jgi:hypothetical protein